MVKGCTNVSICQVVIGPDEWSDMCAQHEHEWTTTDRLRYDDLVFTYDSYDEIYGK